jgi:PST family polysaccharide transporter
LSSRTENKALGERTVTGLFWTFGGAGTIAICRLAALALLARLLTPSDFGAVEATMTCVLFLGMFSQLGVGPAVVQRPVLTQIEVQVAGTLSLLLGIAATTLVCLCADSFSHFFHRDDLQPLFYALSSIYVFQGISAVSEAQLQREMRFRALSVIDVITYAIGYGAIGITAALSGYGIWSLVAAEVGQVVIKTIALLCAKPHALRLSLRAQPVKDLLGFGAGHTVAGLANQLATNGDNLIIGRMLGMSALGAYGRAYQLMVSPATLFGDVVNKVLFPAMSQIQDQSERLTAAYRRSISVIALASMPTAAVLAILSPEIVRFLIGPQWDLVIEPLRILSLGLLFRTSYKVSDTLARATGAVYRRAWRQCVYAAAVLAGAWYGSEHGLTGVAYGVLGAIALNFLLMADLSLRLARMRWTQFVRAHRAGALLCLLALTACYPIAQACRASQFPEAIVLAASGVSALIACGMACWMLPSLFLGDDGAWVLSLMVRKRLSKRI